MVKFPRINIKLYHSNGDNKVHQHHSIKSEIEESSTEQPFQDEDKGKGRGKGKSSKHNTKKLMTL